MNTEQNNWVVVGKDMDGLICYSVIHRSDIRSYEQGYHWTGIRKGLSLQKAEMQALATELNAKNEPAPENPFRGM